MSEKKKGRPFKEKADMQDCRIRLNLTATEKEQVCRAAKADDATPSAWARKQVLKAARDALTPRADK